MSFVTRVTDVTRTSRRATHSAWKQTSGRRRQDALPRSVNNADCKEEADTWDECSHHHGISCIKAGSLFQNRRVNHVSLRGKSMIHVSTLDSCPHVLKSQGSFFPTWFLKTFFKFVIHFSRDFIAWPVNYDMFIFHVEIMQLYLALFSTTLPISHDLCSHATHGLILFTFISFTRYFPHY